MMDSCRLRKPAAGLIATYCRPMAFSTSAMKSEPGWVMKVSLGSFFSPAALPAGLSAAMVSAAWASCVVAASAAPAAAAVPLRNLRRAGLPFSGASFMAFSSSWGPGQAETDYMPRVARRQTPNTRHFRLPPFAFRLEEVSHARADHQASRRDYPGVEERRRQVRARRREADIEEVSGRPLLRAAGRRDVHLRHGPDRADDADHSAGVVPAGEDGRRPAAGSWLERRG